MRRTEFGAWLKERRRSLGLTLQEVCDETGIPRHPFLSQIESGQKPLPVERVKALAKTLRMPLSELTSQMVGVYRDELDARLRGDTSRRSGTSPTRAAQGVVRGSRHDSPGRS